MSQLLTLDLGNSSATLGCWRAGELLADFRVTRGQSMSLAQLQALVPQGFRPHRAIMVSVTPTEEAKWNQLLVEWTKQPVHLVGLRDLERLGMTSLAEGVGMDRLVTAWAAYQKHGGPLVVVDMGTATTFDVMDEQGRFLGGMILPGLELSAKALWEKTDKLQPVDLIVPDRLIGTNTSSAMQSGIILGYAAMVDRLLEKISAEIGQECKVIATGGLANKILKVSEHLNRIEERLTLEGLGKIAESLASME